jgi:Ca2+-binding EF-hand superfamily protein
VKPILTLFAACGFALGASFAEPTPPAHAKPQAATDAYDFVFLAEARPILVRVRVQVDGKPLAAAWNEFVAHLFKQLDRNADGVLDKDEVERAPSAELILSGGLGAGFGQWSPGPKFEDLDANKDGKVSLAEFAAFYRTHGLEPFQFQLRSTPPNPLGGLLGGPRPDPAIDLVSDRIFTLLAGKDGKLTRDKLAAAESILMRLDDDGDELLTPAEIVPDGKPSPNALANLGMMARSTTESDKAGSNETLVPVATRGEAPADLVKRLQARYGPKIGKPEEKKIAAKAIGLDAESFAKLDSNKDGVLDAKELAGFVKLPPDLELLISLGHGEAKVEVTAARVKSAIRDGRALIDLFKTRIDIVGDVREKSDGYSSILRQQGLGQLKQADKQNKGYLTAEDAKSNKTLQGLFKAADRDGDGKLTEAELNAYFDWLGDVQTRASAACVSLVLSDESRGLFDLLDTNRDGKLSIRELRQAPKLLAEFDRAGKGHLTRDDVPKSYRLTLRRGPADGTGIAGIAAVLSQYFTSYSSADSGGSNAGPLWFRKMDRNRDGDVSRKEFIGTDEDFRKIDTDGDGLISLEEAIKADALMRKSRKIDD